jgi:hypothetical protein
MLLPLFKVVLVDDDDDDDDNNHAVPAGLVALARF